MHTDGAIQRTKAIELLGERLVFARSSMELLELVQANLVARDGPYQSVRAHLHRMAEEKRAQCEWLEEQLRSRGADPALLPAAHPLALLQPQAAPAELFESLLRAEIFDSGGWEALRELASQTADDAMAEQIGQMLREEEEHVLFVSRIVARFARTGSVEAAPA